MILAELLNNLNSISMPSFRDQRHPVPAQLGPATLGWAMAHVSDEMTSNAGPRGVRAILGLAGLSKGELVG